MTEPMTPPPVQQIPQEVWKAIDAVKWYTDSLPRHYQAEFRGTLMALADAIRSSLAPQQQPVVGEVSPEVQGRIQEIRQRLEAATPGPWAWATTGEKCYGAAVGAECFAEDDDDAEHPLSGNLSERTDDYMVNQPIADMEHQNANADADLIAHAPADLKFLLDLLGRNLNP